MRIIQISNRLWSISSIGRTNIPILKSHWYYNLHHHHHCTLSINSKHLFLLSSKDIRSFHSSAIFYDDKSKIQKTVTLLKNDKTNEEKAKQSASNISPNTTVPIIRPDAPLTTVATSESTVIKRKSIWERIVHECKHYYNGFKLLFIETKIASRLLRQVLNGHTLTRRERKQFTRTVSDLFRLVPFSVFIIVPFMEFTLPVFLKLFPNMLPSTFKEADKEKEKLKKQLKAKLEVAKFLQDTLESTALKSKKKRSDDALPSQFVEFMNKIRSTGVQPSTEEILKYSSLFENKSTLDNLDRPLLVALCKLVGISSIGPDYYLRYILHLKLRNLEADDKLIVSEGIENLSVEELQAACRERGMRSYGVSIERLRSQLQQWLDLHLNQRIPSTILLVSRALYLPENISPENVLKAAIQSLPKAIDNVTAVKLAQASGERVDNTQRIEYIKREDEVIRKEQEDKEKNRLLTEEELKKKKLAEQIVIPVTPLDVPKAEILVDNVPIIKDKKIQEKKDDEQLDIQHFENVLEQLVNKKAQEVRGTVEDIRNLKALVKDYKEEVKEFETIVATKQLKHLSETRSAKALSNRIDKLVNDLDGIVQTLGQKQDILKKDIQVKEDTLKEEASLKSDQIQQHKDFLTEKRNMLTSTQEFINTIRDIQNASNQSTDAQVMDILHQFDHNKDGMIDADEMLKVTRKEELLALEIIGNEKIQISKKYLKDIINIIRKEHKIKEKEKLETITKQQSIINSMNDIDKSQRMTKNL